MEKMSLMYLVGIGFSFVFAIFGLWTTWQSGMAPPLVLSSVLGLCGLAAVYRGARLESLAWWCGGVLCCGLLFPTTRGLYPFAISVAIVVIAIAIHWWENRKTTSE